MAQLPDDDAFRRRYPHQLSGGQQQRVCIAMALVCEPDVVVMDEPTTGLDVTTQARLLDEIRGLAERLSMAIVYVSHDLGRRAQHRRPRHRALRRAGSSRTRPPTTLFREPRHPYTRRLLEAIPRVDAGARSRGASPGPPSSPGTGRPAACSRPRCELAVDECRPRCRRSEASRGRRVRCLSRGRRPRAPAQRRRRRARRGAPSPRSDVLLALDALRRALRRPSSRSTASR